MAHRNICACLHLTDGGVISRTLSLCQAAQSLGNLGVHASTSPTTGGGVLRSLLITTHGICVHEPFVPDGRTTHGRPPLYDDSYDYYGDNYYHDHYGDRPPRNWKRPKWKDDPATEICEMLPKCRDGDRVESFQMEWLSVLHSPTSSHIPDVLRELRPLQVIFQAALKAHEANTLFRRMLSNVGAASRLRIQLEDLASAHAQTVHLARNDPQNELLQRDVLDVICMALKLIRAMLKHSSPASTLDNEVGDLLSYVNRYNVRSYLDYAIEIDNEATAWFLLWGDRQSAELACRGSGLGTLLPSFVRKLSSSMQDRAIAYYNEIIRSYASMPDEEKPRSLTMALHRITERNSQLFPERPDVASLRVVDVNFNDPDGARRLERFSSMPPCYDSSSRLLTVPDDLIAIAEAGLLLSHWRPFMNRMTGTYTRMNLPGLPLPPEEPGADAAADGTSDDDELTSY